MDSVDQNLAEHSTDIGVGPLLMHDPDSERDHSLSQHESDSILGDVHLPSEGSLIHHHDEKVDSLSSIEPIIDTSDKSTLDSTKPDESCIFTEPVKFTDGQAVQLEDGSTAYILTRYKEGSQQIILEDGTTAYISHEPPSSMLTISDLVNPQLAFDNMPGISGEKHQLIDNDGRKLFECDHEGCGKVYATLHHLTYHQRSHMEKKPFVCGYEGCERTFATSYSLKSHIRVHTGEKPYKCTFNGCDKAFKTSGDLQKHTRTHTGEKPFKCPFEGCDRSFTTSNIRKVHIRTHTGERPYKCEKCGRTFASATNHRNHIRIHTGEKPYVCNVDGCGKRFTEYSSLYKHNVVHTQNKPYQCTSCGKTYRQTSTLAFHRRSAHGETDIIISAGDPELQMTTLSLEQAAKGVVRMLDGTNHKLNIPNHVLIDSMQVTPLNNSTPSTSLSAQPQIFILPDDGTELKMPSTTVSLPVLSTSMLGTMSEATSNPTLNNS